MCGRFILQAKSWAYISEWFDLVDFDFEPTFSPEIAPTQTVAAVVLREGRRVLVPFRWGLIPSWAKEIKIGSRMINARAETVHEKPAFRVAFRKRRCLIPATGFFEWQQRPGGKQRMLIRLESGEPFAFAGLWESWRPRDNPDAAPIHSCTIITTDANELVAPIHDRMPVILAPDDYSAWLDPNFDDLPWLQHLLRNAESTTSGQKHPAAMLTAMDW